MIADAFFAGKVTGYMLYDMNHYFLHHSPYTFGYLKFMKTYHMAHHYKNPNLGFGVSNHFWDIVFGTVLPITAKNSLD